MRDLTKSSLSFSWSLSLFGLQQLGNMLSPGRVTQAFERVAGSMEKQLGDSLGETFRAGDKLQRSVVDLMFRAIGWPSRKSMATAPRMAGGCRLCGRTTWQSGRTQVDAASGWAGNPPPPAADDWPDGATGWGPIPAAGAESSPACYRPTYAGGQP